MSGIWNLSSICRFCHRDGNFRTFTLPNIHNGKLASYGDMLQKTFNIKMSMPTGINASNMICDTCISSLTDSEKFKNQVEACENKFQQYVKNEFFSLASDIKDSDIKTENNEADNSGGVKVEIEFPQTSVVKIENSSDWEDDLSIDNDNLYENYTLNENIVKPDVKPEETRRVAKELPVERSILKDQKSLNSKSSKSRKVKKMKIEKHTFKRKISCRVCSKNLLRSELLEHLKTHKKPYKCTLCQNTFFEYDSLSVHIRKQHGKKLYTCNSCNQPFKTEASLIHHLDKHMRQNVFECDICHRKLINRTVMIRHIKTHDPKRMDKIHECPQCSWKFANNTNLINHIRAVHENIRDYHCSGCPKSFATKRNLEIHFRIHTNERPYKCDTCEKRFRVLEYLNKHKRIHQNEAREDKIYKCSNCNVKFDHKGIYLDHLKTHPEKFLVCDLCGILLFCDKSLARHKLTHAPPKFTCDTCKKSFKSKVQVKRHIKKIHLKIYKKSKCEICGKLFVDLKQHLSTHNNRRFVCPWCQRTYGERRQLTRHLRDVHSGYKLYGCDICNKRYVNKRSLLTHNKKCRMG